MANLGQGLFTTDDFGHMVVASPIPTHSTEKCDDFFLHQHLPSSYFRHELNSTSEAPEIVDAQVKCL
jgi:hypothetical protein